MIDASSFLWSQLLFQFPTLLVLVVAFVIGLMNLRRAPMAAALVLAGLGTMLCAMILGFDVQLLMMQREVQGNRLALLGFFSLGANCLRAVGFLLIIVAAFAGRGPRPSNDDAAGFGQKEVK
jgi:hypothetical protein